MDRLIGSLAEGAPDPVEVPDHIRSQMTDMGMDPDSVVFTGAFEVAPGLKADAYVIQKGNSSSGPNESIWSGDWRVGHPGDPLWWVDDSWGGMPPGETTTTFDMSDNPKPEGVIITHDEMRRADSVIAVLDGTKDLNSGLEVKPDHYVSEVIIRKPNGEIAGSVIKVDGEWVYNKDNAL